MGQLINLGNLYDFNKKAMGELEPLDPVFLNIKIKSTAEDMEKKKYWMLLCHERRDYSVFKIKNKENIKNELKETLCNRGLILGVDRQEDGSYEIWIRDPKTEENFVYYLFDYTYGIIET